MPFLVKHRSIHPGTLAKHFADAEVIDLTSKGPDPWVRFSPFFPHGGVPVPFTPGRVGQSVEGIWQGLKVFETADIDVDKFENTTMKRLKRTVRRFGRCLGHRAGVGGAALLDYRTARWRVYLPTYRWVLENRLAGEVERLRALGADRRVLLLDYEINTRVDDLRRPLSHAGLVRCWLEGRWPEAPADVAEVAAPA